MILPGNGFTLWLPAHVERIPTSYTGDYAIEQDSIVCAYVSGTAIGMVGMYPVHRIGRRDA